MLLNPFRFATAETECGLYVSPTPTAVVTDLALDIVEPSPTAVNTNLCSEIV